MQNILKIITVTLSLLMLLSACGKTESVTPGLSDKYQNSSKNENIVSPESEAKKEESKIEENEAEYKEKEKIPADFNLSDDDMFTKRDQNTDYDNSAVIVNLSDGNITSTSNSVIIEGNKVIIKEENDYIIKGDLSDGQIVIDADEKDKPHLIFENVNINANNKAALYVIECDKLSVTLIGENSLKSSGEFIDTDSNGVDGAVFSKQDLSFNGEGTLKVEAEDGHGIVCKDDLVLINSSFNIISSNHGIDVNDSLRVKEANLDISSGKDGVHSENNDDNSLGFIYISGGNFNISSEGDGLSAGSYIQINSGNFDIITGGGSENGEKKTSENWGMPGGGMPGGFGGGGRGNRPGSITTIDLSTAIVEDEAATSIKALKASNSVLINDGKFIIDSADDSIHSNLNITINGGEFEIESGDDGIHADEDLIINGGIFNIKECYEGIEAHNITINDGSFTIVADDDGINAAGGKDQSGMGGRDQMFGGMGGGFGGGMGMGDGSIIINGGDIYMNASGDGIDANGYLEINGGYTVVCGPTQGDTSVLDFDTSAEITGGTFIGTGSSMMAHSFTGGTQGTIALSVGNQIAGTNIIIKDSKGNEIINVTPKLDYQIMVMSSPEIIKGEIYEVFVGSLSGEFDAK